MKNFFTQLKKDNIPFLAFCVLCLLYILIFFADFFAVYPSTYSNRKLAYQPPNNVYIIDKNNKLTKPYTYNYVKTYNKDTFSIEYKQDRSKKYYLKFFSKGYEYKILGLIKTNIHLFSVPNECNFHILGENSIEYEEYVKNAVEEGVVYWHGRVNNVNEYIAKSHCTIHPSFFEGMANVILESAASGRPIITTNVYGCKEGVDDGVTGFIYKVNDTKDLVKVIRNFLNLKYDEKVAMGLAGRMKMEREFDRNLVVQAYEKQIISLI